MHLNWEKNLGNTDRLIRAVLGLLLLALVFTGTVTGRWAVAALALALFQFVEARLAY